MSDLLDLSAVEARAALDAKSISATELTTAYIARCRRDCGAQ